MSHERGHDKRDVWLRECSFMAFVNRVSPQIHSNPGRPPLRLKAGNPRLAVHGECRRGFRRLLPASQQTRAGRHASLCQETILHNTQPDKLNCHIRVFFDHQTAIHLQPGLK